MAMGAIPAAATCALKPALPPARRRVSVNGVEIAPAAIAAETQHHPALAPQAAIEAAARALVVRELLLQEARRLGLAPEPRVDAAGRLETCDEAAIRVLLERQAPAREPDISRCRRYYEKHRGRFRSAALYSARHILIAADPANSAARQAARAQAQSICARLRARPADFAAVAASSSACPSRTVGGELGQIGQGQTVPEFEAALDGLGVGEVADAPVETRYGFHVVCVDRRVEGRELPFEFVAGRIAVRLREISGILAERQYVRELAARAAVTGVDPGFGVATGQARKEASHVAR
jgi:peptidyl-prolyl cis-trans isomerase C